MTQRSISDDDLDAVIRSTLRSVTEQWHARDISALPTGEERVKRSRSRPRSLERRGPVIALIVVAAIVAVVGVLVGRSSLLGNNRNPSTHQATQITPPAHFTPNPSPSLPRSLFGELNGVACASPGECWAVGGFAGSGALIARYTENSWAIVSTPSAGVGLLTAVACSSAVDCWAVGGSGHGTPVPLIEHYTGSSWTAVAIPNDGPGLLTGVACSIADNCWAVGYSGDMAANPRPLIEHGSGAGWAVVSTPYSGVGLLKDVVCTSAGKCWAVGSAGSNAGSATPSPLIEHHDGSGWTVVDTKSLGPGALMAVTCVSAVDCWAVGTNGAALIEHNRGSGWAVVGTSQPTPGSSGNLTAVTCVSIDDCWAVGLSSGRNVQPLIEHFNGSTWAIVTSPLLPQGVVNGVTCNTAGECWAVGLFSSDPAQPLDFTQPLIEHYIGGKWGIVGDTNPAKT